MPSLFHHSEHPHVTRNANTVYAERHAAAGFQTRLAVSITRHTGTMAAAYVFALLAIIGLFGLLGLLNPFIFLLTTWISQQFLQLVLLPVILVGQNVLSQRQEIQANEQFKTSQNIYIDSEQLVLHMHAQDQKLVEIEHLLLQQEVALATTQDALLTQLSVALSPRRNRKKEHTNGKEI